MLMVEPEPNELGAPATASTGATTVTVSIDVVPVYVLADPSLTWRPALPRKVKFALPASSPSSSMSALSASKTPPPLLVIVPVSVSVPLPWFALMALAPFSDQVRFELCRSEEHTYEVQSREKLVC